jgi:hypothetical protein
MTDAQAGAMTDARAEATTGTRAPASPLPWAEEARSEAAALISG